MLSVDDDDDDDDDDNDDDAVVLFVIPPLSLGSALILLPVRLVVVPSIVRLVDERGCFFVMLSHRGKSVSIEVLSGRCAILVPVLIIQRFWMTYRHKIPYYRYLLR